MVRVFVECHHRSSFRWCCNLSLASEQGSMQRASAELWPVLCVFIICLLSSSTSFDESAPSNPSNLCGARSLAHKVAVEAVWTIKGSNVPKPLYQECKFIHARYNCSRFKTSAPDYQILFSNSSTQNCRVPTFSMLSRILDRRHTNLFMIGGNPQFQTSPPLHHLSADSHVQQMFESILCIFKHRIRELIVYQRDSNTSEAHPTADMYTPQTYPGYKEVPSCHTIAYANYKNFFLDSEITPEQQMSNRDCTVSHFAGQTSCAKLPTVDGNHSMFCFSYIRPLRGMDAIQAGMNESLRSLNISIKDFHVIVTNTYVSSTALAEFVALSNYTGRILAIPRFPFGNQSNSPFQGRTIPSPQNLSTSLDYTKTRWVMGKYCSAFSGIPPTPTPQHGHHPHTLSSSSTLPPARREGSDDLEVGSESRLRLRTKGRRLASPSTSSLSSPHKGTPVEMRRPFPPENPCVAVDFSRLVFERSADSKASIFPLTYHNNDSTLTVCQVDQTSVNTCEGHDFRVCGFDKCNEESHFCMPGPTDELSLLVLASSISHKDHRHHKTADPLHRKRARSL